MNVNSNRLLVLFKPRRIIIPILIGLGVATYLVVSNFDKEAYSRIEWDLGAGFFILLGLMMLVARDLMYMIRIRLLTDYALNWRQAFDVIMIWEFASSVTPSIVGGTAAAFFVLAKEKISAGRSTAVVLLTAFLDELFFIVATPVVFLLIGLHNAFPPVDENVVRELFYGRSIQIVFLIGYVILLAYTLLLAYGLFINPRGLKWLIIRLFSVKFLKKYKHNAIQIGNDVIIASEEFSRKKVIFWVKAFGTTILTWSARYLMVNFLIIAFFAVDSHLIVYGRQLGMWVILLITPTPGGSGMAEVIFPLFFKDIIPATVAPSIGFLWRLLSYYPYLFIGAIVLPNWIRRVFATSHPEEVKNDTTDTKEVTP